MAKSKTTSQINLKPIGSFFRRFHFLIFFVILVGCIGASLYYINSTFTNIPDDGYTSTIKPGTIDQKALERIQTLHISNDPANSPVLPNGRTNAFAE